MLSLLLVLAVAWLAGGCGGSAEPEEPGEANLTLGYTRWEESVALSSLTKVLLEEELGYGSVTLERTGAPEVFREVAGGGLDAFQGVWVPGHEDYLEEVDGEVELLGPWLAGTTRASLAAPAYMGVESVEQLGSTGAARILGVEPGAAATVDGSLHETLSRYPLEKDVYPDAPAMLREVERLYGAREPFFFTAWSPHRMNLEYEFDYLVDPNDVLGDMPEPSRIHPIVRTGLGEQDPVAYLLIDVLQLTDHQVSSLELEIHNAANPTEGARSWAEKNGRLVGEWLALVEDRTRD